MADSKPRPSIPELVRPPAANPAQGPLTTDELLGMLVERVTELEQRVAAAEARLGLAPSEVPETELPPLPAASHSPEIENHVASSFLNYFGLLVLLAGLGLLIAYFLDSHSTAAVLLTCASGAALWLLAGWMRRHGSQVFSLTLEGTSLGLIYLACYLSYVWWGMVPSLAAGTGVMLLAIRRAFLRDAQLVAVFALTAAFIGPLFLRSARSGESLIFGYLAVVNGAALWAGHHKQWTGIRVLALTASHLVAGFWYATHPTATLALTAVFPVLTFVLFARVVPVGVLKAPEVTLGILNSIGFLAASLSLTRVYHPALVYFVPAALGAIHLLFAVAWLRSSSRQAHAPLHFWIGGCLVAAGLPLCAPLALAALGWTAQAFVIGWWGTSRNSSVARNAANLLALAAAVAIVFATGSSDAAYNRLATIAALSYCASVVARHRMLSASRDAMGNWEWSTHWMLAVLATILPMLTLSRHVPSAGGPIGLLGPSLATAVLWSAYSMGLCVVGWFLVSSFLRWAGVALLLVTSVRVLLVDMVAMSGPARIVSFLLLAAFLLVISYLFQSRTRAG